MITFSDTSTNTGGVQQTRKMMRVDSTQWPTANIVASFNNWLDFITGYAIGADKRFQFDDTNHTKLPVGTTNLVASQSDYSFLTDEQSNTIITLTRIDMLQTTGGDYRQLLPIDQAEIVGALEEQYPATGVPEYYDKIADNIIRLYPTPSASITAGLKFYFQRSPSYFVAADTTKAPGVAPILHRGFVIAGAYDGALTLGLANLSALSAERERERQIVVDYFAKDRSQDETVRFIPEWQPYE